MEKSKSELIGLFTFNETCKAYQQKMGKYIGNWILEMNM